jgi:hypothetical protein
MLIRNSEGKLQIINRKDCKNETEYNHKLYKVRLDYSRIYKTIILHNIETVPQQLDTKPKKIYSKL